LTCTFHAGTLGLNLKAMKNLLPALCVLLIFFTGCKKDKASGPVINGSAATATPSSSGTPTPLSPPTLTAISPQVVTAGTLVTITGSNFVSPVTVFFQNQQAIVQSVTATEIKVIAPQTTSGLINVRIGGIQIPTAAPLVYTYYEAAGIGPYTSGDVKLGTQADVDAFVTANKGKRLQINGSLTIGFQNTASSIKSDITSVTGLTNMITAVSGMITFKDTELPEAPFLNTLTAAGGITVTNCNFTALKLDGLQSFFGDILITNERNLNHLSISNLTGVNNFRLTNCPLVTDLSFLNSIQTAASVKLNALPAVTSIHLDNLNTITSSGISVTSNVKLNDLSFKSLNRVEGPITVGACVQLSSLNFNTLQAASGRVTLANTNLTDMSAFSALQTAGALNITLNPLLTNLHGLEKLATLTMPAITGSINEPSISFSFTIGGVPAILGGVTILSNTRLSSLTGLQNLKAAPVAYIVNNSALSDLCSFKTPIITLSTLPAYEYIYNDVSGGLRYKRVVAALTLQGNGDYPTLNDALAAVALCK
jgi:hypothetical protein